MSLNEKFEASKQILVNAYKRLSDCELVLDRDSIPEQLALLNSEQFVISICGAIKTGKTTFINYLLFDGNEILPVDATPETAKLAKISKGPVKKAVIHFLSRAEFDDYKESKAGQQDNEVAKTLLELKVTEYVKDSPVSLELDSVDELSNYISKKSIYSPLVKNADIYLEERVLENVVIVDTPGLNDPCQARSQVTLDWVSKSDAIIYITRAQQAMTKDDLDFLDNYCNHIDPDKFILVLGQIDLVNDHRYIEKYIQTVVKSPDFDKRDYLRKLHWFPISVMAAMLKNNADKVKDFDHYSNMINPKLVENEGFMPELEKAVNQSLMTSKGEGVLRSHRAKILSMLTRSMSDLEIQKCILEDRLENVGKNKKEIEAKRESLEALAILIEEERNNSQKVLDREQDKLNNHLVVKFNRIKGQTVKDYRMKCDGWKSFDLCVTNTAGFVRDHIKESVSDLGSSEDERLKKFTDTMNSEFGRMQRSLSDKIRDISRTGAKFQELRIDLSDLQDRICDMVNVILNRKELRKGHRKSLLLIATDRARSVNELKAGVDDKLEGLYTEVRKIVSASIETDINKMKKEYFDRVDAYSNGIKRNLQDVETMQLNEEKSMMDINDQIYDIVTKIDELKTIERDIKSKLSDLKGV